MSPRRFLPWFLALQGLSYTIHRVGGFAGPLAVVHIDLADVECGEPGDSHCLYIVKKSKSEEGLCGGECDECPLRKGDSLCLESCEEKGDCRKKIKTSIPCQGGGACAIKAKAVACANCESNCR